MNYILTWLSWRLVYFTAKVLIKLVCRFKIFLRLDLDWWVVFVPGYNDLALAQACDVAIYGYMNIVCLALTVALAIAMSPLCLMTLILSSLCISIITLCMAERLGWSKLWRLLFFLFPIIGWPIIAFYERD